MLASVLESEFKDVCSQVCPSGPAGPPGPRGPKGPAGNSPLLGQPRSDGSMSSAKGKLVLGTFLFA